MLKQAIVALILSCVLYHTYRVIYRMQYERFDVLATHHPGPCRQLIGKGGGGSEDIVTLPDGRAFITSGIFQSKKGRILMFNFKDESLQELRIDGELNNFHPLGMDIWTDHDTGKMTFYVVNHGKKNGINVFEFISEKGTLKYIKTIETQGRAMNNLVLMENNKFYVTEYMRYPDNYYTSLVEMYGMFNLGRVWFYNGNEFIQVLSDLGFPNGIAASKDKSIIYLAEVFRKQVTSFKRNSDNSLQRLQTVFVDTVPDNINIDQVTGDLWIGCQPRLYSILEYGSLEGDLQSPSQVIKMKGSNLTEVTEILMDDGRLVSGSSVASFYKGRVLIGTVGTELVICDVLYNE